MNLDISHIQFSTVIAYNHVMFLSFFYLTYILQWSILHSFFRYNVECLMCFTSPICWYVACFFFAMIYISHISMSIYYLVCTNIYIYIMFIIVNMNILLKCETISIILKSSMSLEWKLGYSQYTSDLIRYILVIWCMHTLHSA